MPATPRPAQELAVPCDDLAARHRKDRHAGDGEGVERVVAGARMQPALVDRLDLARIEENKVGVAADRDGAFPRIEAEDPGRVRRESGHEGLERDSPA